jgi:hypothetical protein
MSLAMRSRTLRATVHQKSVVLSSGDFGDVGLFALMSALVVLVAMLLLTAITGAGR